MCIRTSFAKDMEVYSPDRDIKAVMNLGVRPQITIYRRGQELLRLNNIALNIEGKSFDLSDEPGLQLQFDEERGEIIPVIKEKYASIRDHYNELKVNFGNGFGLLLRVYDTGVAYRIFTNFEGEVIIDSEELDMHLAPTDSSYFQPSNNFNSAYETPYEHQLISDLDSTQILGLPFLIKNKDGINVLIMESDLKDYPGLWLTKTGDTNLGVTQAPLPFSFKEDGDPYQRGQVTGNYDYIAKTQGQRKYPWRIFAIAENDGGLLSNTLVYQLAEENKVKDTTWIKPGVVTFDWWGRRNIYGTDFKSGVNTATAKYFIDFAADFGFEYFLLDDGWSKQDDILAVNPALDMEEVMDYADQKGVKVMLWAIWNTFLAQEEAAWKQFEKWGVAGIKFDFMNRDDQKMVEFYHHIAQKAAERKMILDLHGAYKPAGLRRAYPNLLTREGLIEFEFNGWTEHVTPVHDNMLPYLRMVTGPMDYIPFTTHNATKGNFRSVGDRPMSQGTRAHSMAMFVVFESPLQMLPDSPSDYYRERECTEFISKIPTEWDDLKVLHAKIGSHTVLARKKGNDWYIGGITNWDARSLDVNFDFLDEGTYMMEYIQDGANSDTRASDYKKTVKEISRNDTVKINLASGGGWVARITKKD